MTQVRDTVGVYDEAATSSCSDRAVGRCSGCVRGTDAACEFTHRGAVAFSECHDERDTYDRRFIAYDGPLADCHIHAHAKPNARADTSACA